MLRTGNWSMSKSVSRRSKEPNPSEFSSYTWLVLHQTLFKHLEYLKQWAFRRTLFDYDELRAKQVPGHVTMVERYVEQDSGPSHAVPPIPSVSPLLSEATEMSEPPPKRKQTQRGPGSFPQPAAVVSTPKRLAPGFSCAFCGNAKKPNQR